MSNQVFTIVFGLGFVWGAAVTQCINNIIRFWKDI